MTVFAKITWSIVLILLAIIAIASQIILVRQPFIQLTQYTLNSGELTDEALVGQTFTAPTDNLSGIGVMFATYSNRNNTHPVELHVRESIDAKNDLRVATVHPSKLGDNQFYRFTFDPIADAAGKQFFFFVVSPGSNESDAVTVDINNKDPYHEGTAYLVRGQGPNVTNPIILSRSGKQNIDVVFQTYHSITIREAAIKQSRDAYHNFVASWHEHRSDYMIRMKMVGIGVAIVVLILLLQFPLLYERVLKAMREHTFIFTVLVLLVACGIGLRYWYASELPITNDEGNYLYDAKMLRQGILAGGDGYVKAPLFIVWVAVWQFIAGNTVIAGRLSSVVIGALTLIPLYFLAYTIWGALYAGARKRETVLSENAHVDKKVGIVTAALWALCGAPIVYNVYVHTQSVAVFFGVCGIAVLVAALRGKTPHISSVLSEVKEASVPGWFVLAGMLLGLGVASRKSILALGLIPLILILVEGRTVKNRLRHYVLVGLGFAIIIGVFLGVAYYFYGSVGVSEAIGLNSAEDGITGEDIDPEVLREYSLKGMTPFFRESLPLILLSLIGWGSAGEKLLLLVYLSLQKGKELSSRFARILKYVIPKLAWIAPWLAFSWMWSFFFNYEGEVFFGYGIEQLWYFFGGVLFLVMLLPNKEQDISLPKKDGSNGEDKAENYLYGGTNVTPVVKKEETEVSWQRVWWHVSAFLIGPLWIGGLVFFYTNWIKFHANYISEFIPPFVLLSGLGAFELYRRLVAVKYGLRWPLILICSVGIVWAIGISNYITYNFEHTGTFFQSSVKEAAAWAKEHIPMDVPIFTGAAVVPYVSGHHVALDIAHPRWYAYEFTRNDTGRISTFLPPVEDMLNAYRNAQWFLLDRQTGFSFLMEYSEIEAGLEHDWEAVESIENGSNPLVFYHRIPK